MTYLQIWLHFIFRDTSKFNRFFCLYIFTRFKQRISSELIDMHMVHLQIFEKTVTVHFACSWGFRHLKHCPINMFKDTFCLWKQWCSLGNCFSFLMLWSCGILLFMLITSGDGYNDHTKNFVILLMVIFFYVSLYNKLIFTVNILAWNAKFFLLWTWHYTNNLDML